MRSCLNTGLGLVCALTLVACDRVSPLPECLASPGGSARLYEYMRGPSEFVSTGTLRDYARIDRLAELKLPTLFLVGGTMRPGVDSLTTPGRPRSCR